MLNDIVIDLLLQPLTAFPHKAAACLGWLCQAGVELRLLTVSLPISHLGELATLRSSSSSSARFLV